MTPIGRLATSSVLVRGANGFLGGALARGLLGRCARLRLFCRRPELLDRALCGGDAEIVVADALDPVAVGRSLRDIDLVLDCLGATVPAVAPADLLPEVERTLRPLAILLDAMARSPGRQLCFLSSGGAIYGSRPLQATTEETATSPESAYGVGKLLAEEMIRFRARRGDVAFLIARAANVYGRERLNDLPQGVVDIFIDRALRGEPLDCWGDGSQVRDYLFVDDFAAAILALLDVPVRDDIVNVATGVGSSLGEVIAAVERAAGPTVQRRAAGGFPAGVDRSVLAIAKLQALTGWAPRFDLSAGVGEAVRRRVKARGESADEP